MVRRKAGRGARFARVAALVAFLGLVRFAWYVRGVRRFATGENRKGGASLNHWMYECPMCEWRMVVPTEMLEFELIRAIAGTLVESHHEYHAAEVQETAEALIR